MTGAQAWIWKEGICLFPVQHTKPFLVSSELNMSLAVPWCVTGTAPAPGPGNI